MDTSDFLRTSILKMEEQLENNRKSLREVGEAVGQVRQDLKVLETKVIAESRFYAIGWSIATAALLKIFSEVFSSFK